MTFGATFLMALLVSSPIETLFIPDLDPDVRVEVCGVLGMTLAGDAQGCVDAPGDWCTDEGWYGDGWCDPDCPQPDPDCVPSPESTPTDVCETEGWYGDGLCDEVCAQPDPDCAATDGDAAGSGTSDDFCAAQGWYGDGICDLDCTNPDPDCA